MPASISWFVMSFAQHYIPFWFFWFFYTILVLHVATGFFGWPAFTLTPHLDQLFGLQWKCEYKIKCMNHLFYHVIITVYCNYLLWMSKCRVTYNFVPYLECVINFLIHLYEYDHFFVCTISKHAGMYSYQIITN